MSFYILLLFTITMTSVCTSFSKSSGVKLIFKLITFLLIFIPAAIRYDVGADYFSYTKLFYRIGDTGAHVFREPFFTFINKTLYDSGYSSTSLMVFCAFFIPFFMFLNVNTKKWWVYVPVYMMTVYLWTLTTLRQMCAMSLVFCALELLYKKKYFLAIPLAVSSFFFHISSLFYIPIGIMVIVFPLKRGKAIIIFLITFVVTVVFTNRAKNMIFSLAGFTSYAGYTRSSWADAAEVSTGLGRFLRFAVYFVLLLFYPETGTKTNQRILSLFTMYICIDLISQIMVIINRIGRGFIFVYILVAWQYIISAKNRYSAKPYICFLSIFLIFLLHLYGFAREYPYKTIFFR